MLLAVRGCLPKLGMRWAVRVSEFPMRLIIDGRLLSIVEGKVWGVTRGRADWLAAVCR